VVYNPLRSVHRSFRAIPGRQLLHPANGSKTSAMARYRPQSVARSKQTAWSS